LTCLFVVQQLHVEPETVEVGDPIVVRALGPDGAVEGASILVQTEGAEARGIGTTDGHGLLRFVAEVHGQHVFVADIAGVRCLTPVLVAPRRSRWLLAFGSVPLGLALLWLHARRFRRERDRRGS
jgi:hypothetical protein